MVDGAALLVDEILPHMGHQVDIQAGPPILVRSGGSAIGQVSLPVSKKRYRPEVPEPACLHKRQQPLPGYKPKPSEEDRQAPAKLQAILNSSSYVPAIEDVDFLGSDDARGVRWQRAAGFATGHHERWRTRYHGGRQPRCA